MRVLQIANYVEGAGGIAVQVKFLHDKLEGEGIECDILSTKGSYFKRIKAFFRLFHIGNKFDVFHIHACSGRGFLPAVLGITVGRVFNKRIVLTYHGGGAEEFFKKREGLVRFYLAKTNVNIALSGFIGQVFAKYGLKYIVIPNLIEINDSVFRHRTVFRPRFVSTRSLSETYNIECTLRAFGIIKTSYPEAELFLLGDGPLRQELEGFVKNNELTGVTFVGKVDNTHIYDFLDRADIMISSSRFDNMPVSILEGFNSGTLVIASNVGGVPFIVKDRVNGLLFESNNESQLADLMDWAINNHQIVSEITKKAKESLHKYTWEFNRLSLLSVYKG